MKLERLQDELERKKSDAEHARADFDRDRTQLAEKLEGMKRKLSEAQDDAMRQRLESGREQALGKQ